jgi:predicted TIM-barrel fold metal-dependent hydrolase
MAAARPEVIDADAHVVEGYPFVAEVIERFPDQVAIRTDGQLGVLIEGRAYPDPVGPGAGCPADKGLTENEPGADPTSAKGILHDADVDGIDEMVLFPSFAMCVPSIEDPVLAGGIARRYNEWAADLVADGHGRLHAAAAVPVAHGALGTAVLAEAKELGLVCAVVPPALADRNLDHPDLDDFYAAAAALDMPLGVHGAPGLHLPKIGVDRFTNYVQVHCVSFPFDQMTAMTAMVSGGVFDRHPGLRVAFLEAGAGWLAWFTQRLGEHFESRGDWIAGGWRRHPRAYVEAGNVVVTCEPDEDMVPATVAVLGDRCVMYASDYPHWDGAWPRSSTELLNQRLEPAALARVAAANARDFYRMAAPPGP